MKVDVFVTPGGLAASEVVDRTVVMIDVLRASSTMVEALAAGAKAIYPVASAEEAIRLANSLGRDGVLLCGERKCLPIEGFDLGNSPREFTPERVAGKTLVMTTTNGTRALTAINGATRVLIASALNLNATVDELVRSGDSPVLLCSGREQQLALEDVVCAGKIAARVMERGEGAWRANDGVRGALTLAREYSLDESFFAITAAGRAIADAGLGPDLAFCAQVNRHSFVPIFRNRHVALPVAPAAPER